MQMARSRGLCRVAACAISQQASTRGRSPRPAMPNTPRSGRATVTGTSGAVQVISRLCSWAAGSSITTSLGRSAVPSRRRR